MMLLYASLSSFHHSHLSPNLNQDHNFHRVIFILSNPKKKLPEKTPYSPSSDQRRRKTHSLSHFLRKGGVTSRKLKFDNFKLLLG